MRLARYAEHKYIKEHLREVRHITLDPNGPGVVRVHMIPTDTAWDRSVPYLLILNGQYILPIGLSWAIMLNCFIDRFSPLGDGKKQPAQAWKTAMQCAVNDVMKVYPQIKKQDVEKELDMLLEAVKTVAVGEMPKGKLRVLSLGEYAVHMTAPHRMDLMVSAMTENGRWHCNQKCLHCYAAGQAGAEVSELGTDAWKRVIDICRKANIPQLTFTGGEPTLRDDLVELVNYSKWFVTRLNTNGRLMTPELCRELYDASLDNVQITLYSGDREIHNSLVGADGFDDTVRGIENAVAAGLGCSVNTPLCSVNADYVSLLEFLNKKGIVYVTCSGLIPSGNALKTDSTATKLSPEELYEILKYASDYCAAHGMEISFTSPGWLSSEQLKSAGIKQIPSCGACLSNMAVRPDGEVIPCQSWLSDGSLGNILKTPWSRIWNSKKCSEIRAVSAGVEYVCQLDRKNGREVDSE